MAVGGEDALRLSGVGNPSPVVLTNEQLLARSTGTKNTDPVVAEIFGESSDDRTHCSPPAIRRPSLARLVSPPALLSATAWVASGQGWLI